MHQANENHPEDVYQFLKNQGAQVQQYIPIVEQTDHGKAAKWNVSPTGFGRFLNTIFDEWVANDIGKVFITNFEDTLGAWMGTEHGICIFEETCGNALALEHDGSVYSCDHYVFPENHIGNLLEDNLTQLAVKPIQKQFGNDKKTTLTQQCLECSIKPLCNGGCPKHRFVHDKYGNSGHNYLCQSYLSYFSHTAPQMQSMVTKGKFH